MSLDPQERRSIKDMAHRRGLEVAFIRDAVTLLSTERAPSTRLVHVEGGTFRSEPCTVPVSRPVFAGAVEDARRYLYSWDARQEAARGQ